MGYELIGHNQHNYQRRRNQERTFGTKDYPQLVHGKKNYNMLKDIELG